MACRFHKQRIFEAEIFGSWVIWIWELWMEEEFSNRWDADGRIKYNYVETFRHIISAGIYLPKQLRDLQMDRIPQCRRSLTATGGFRSLRL
jgi:hypothetical protein